MAVSHDSMVNRKNPQIFLTTLYMGSLSMAFILYWFKWDVYRSVADSDDNISLRGHQSFLSYVEKMDSSVDSSNVCVFVLI